VEGNFPFKKKCLLTHLKKGRSKKFLPSPPPKFGKEVLVFGPLAPNKFTPTKPFWARKILTLQKIGPLAKWF